MGRLAQLIAGRSVLADEIANLDTPGYQGQGSAAFAAQLRVALDRRLGGTPSTGTPPGVVAPVSATPVPLVAGMSAGGSPVPFPPLSASLAGNSGTLTPDGNGMSLDALMAQFAQTDLDYQAVTRQLQLTYTNLSEAIDKGGA